MPLLSRLLAESAPALIEGDEIWSYGQLRDAVGAAAAALGAPGQVGFLWCRNDRATVVGYLAALRAGHAVALFDRALDASAAAALVASYRPDWQLGAAAVDGDAYADAGEASLPSLRRRRQPDATAPHPELAVLLSTSGSTGSRKLVRLSRAAVLHSAQTIAEALAIAPTDRAPTSLPLHYAYGLSVLASHLVAGAAVVLTDDGLVGDGFWRAVRRHACTSLAAVPHGYQILRRLDLDRLEVPALTTLTQAGGRLDPALVAHFAGQLQRRGGRLFVMYGQTEATARITVLPPAVAAQRPASVGRPLRDGHLAILRDGRGAGPDEVGEIVYRGPNVMMGYATARADLARGDELGGELHTGDLGFVDAEGLLHVTGRISRFAKVHGVRISLDEVEVLARLDGPVAAIGGPDQLVVFYEGVDDGALATLRRELARRLRLHVSAISVRTIPTLPRSASGKIDYPRLAS